MPFTYAGRYGPEPLLNLSGRPLPSESVTVYLTGTTTLASLYTNRSKSTAAANPTTSDVRGNLSFFADPGDYDILVNGVTVNVTVPVDTIEVAQDSDLANYQQLFSVVAAAPTGTSATDAAAITAAIDALPAAGGEVILQDGAYAINAGITIAKPVLLRGQGGMLVHYGRATAAQRGVTTLLVDSTTANGLTITAAGAVLADFALVNTSGTTPTAGAGIDAADAHNIRMVNLTISGFYDDAKVEGSWWRAEGCHFLDPIRYGLWVTTADADLYDHGDFALSDAVFAMWRPGTATAAIRWEAMGGVRIANTKIVGQQYVDGVSGGTWNYGADFAVKDGVSTVELEWVGGNVSSCSVAAFRFRQAGPSNTGTFSRVTITGVTSQGYGTTATFLVAGGAVSTANSAIGNLRVGGCIVVGYRDGVILHNCTGIQIDESTWAAITRDIAVVADNSVFGTDNTGQTRAVYIAHQNIGHNGGVLPTNQNIIRDRRTPLQSNGHWRGRIDYRYEREFSLTAVGTWVTLFSFIPVQPAAQSHAAGLITVDMAGHDSGQQAFGFRTVRSYQAAGVGAVVTVATQGADLAWGYAARYEFRLDTTTTAGTVLVQARLVSPGTWVAGKISIDLRGLCYLFGLGTVAA